MSQHNYGLSRRMTRLAGITAVAALSVSPIASAQGRWERGAFTRLEPGEVISVRTNEFIDSARPDYRVYSGIVNRDVRGTNGRIAIPRGATVELMARPARNGDLVLDLESVVVNGERYAIKTDPNRVVATGGNDGVEIVGSILGAVTGGQIRGRAIRVPRGTQMQFRLDRPLDVGVDDRGVMREGHHYHDWYRDNPNGDPRDDPRNR